MRATPASDLLRAEHRLLELQLDRLSRLAKHPVGDLVPEVRRILSSIQRLSQPHFEKEETAFYPLLRPHFPELLSELDNQHEYVREVEQYLVELIESSTGSATERQSRTLYGSQSNCVT